MKSTFFSKNGTILPIKNAVVSIDKIERMYEFGVYESIKIRNNILYFIDQHVDRLLYSARCINLKHDFSPKIIATYITDFAKKIEEESTNIKMLLLGGKTTEDVELLLFSVLPLFPKKEWYRDGVTVYPFKYERWMPNAKSLNMLPSYFYYKQSKKQGGYDSLFIDSSGNVREGSRTNFYTIKRKTIFSPPKADILEGVTMMTLEKVIQKTDYMIEYMSIPMSSLSYYDSLFLTSTSSKILPISRVDMMKFQVSSELKDLIKIYNKAIDASNGNFERLVFS